MSSLLALSGHRDGAEQCPLLGVKRTLRVGERCRRLALAQSAMPVSGYLAFGSPNKHRSIVARPLFIFYVGEVYAYLLAIRKRFSAASRPLRHFF